MTAVFRSKPFAARVRKLTGVSGTKLAPVRSRWDSKACWAPGVIGGSVWFGVPALPRTERARLRDARLPSVSRSDEAKCAVSGGAKRTARFLLDCIPDYD